MKTKIQIVLDTNAIVTKNVAFTQYVQRTTAPFATILEEGMQYVVIRSEKMKGACKNIVSEEW